MVIPVHWSKETTRAGGIQLLYIRVRYYLSHIEVLCPSFSYQVIHITYFWTVHHLIAPWLLLFGTSSFIHTHNTERLLKEILITIAYYSKMRRTVVYVVFPRICAWYLPTQTHTHVQLLYRAGAIVMKTRWYCTIFFWYLLWYFFWYREYRRVAVSKIIY